MKMPTEPKRVREKFKKKRGRVTKRFVENFAGLELSKEQQKVLRVFTKKNCNISKTCVAANISRSTFWKWEKESRDFRIAVRLCRDFLVDLAESKLKILINKGNPDIAKFVAKTLGKDRGYTEKLEIDIQQARESIQELVQEMIKVIKEEVDDERTRERISGRLDAVLREHVS